jgi:hypothetical protein
MTHLTVSYVCFQLSDVQVLWLWHHHLHIWTLLLVIRGFSSYSPMWIWICEAHIGQFLRQTGSSRLIFTFAITCAAVVPWFSKQSSMYNGLFLSMLIFAHCSSSLMLSSQWFVFADITLKTVTLEAPNNVAFFLWQMLQLNMHELSALC